MGTLRAMGVLLISPWFPRMILRANLPEYRPDEVRRRVGEAPSEAHEPGESMRILIVGDLMGAGAEEAPPIDQRPIVPIASIRWTMCSHDSSRPPACRLWDCEAPLRFETLDDFHPDRLFDTGGNLRPASDAPPAPSEPVDVRGAAAELRSMRLRTAPRDGHRGRSSRRSPEQVGALLDRLLARRPVRLHARGVEPSSLRRLASMPSFARW